jgi:hypothetical protein
MRLVECQRRAACLLAWTGPAASVFDSNEQQRIQHGEMALDDGNADAADVVELRGLPVLYDLFSRLIFPFLHEARKIAETEERLKEELRSSPRRMEPQWMRAT